MTGIIIALLVLWLLVSLAGVIIEGLLWLLFIGLILMAATVVWGFVRGRGSRAS